MFCNTPADGSSGGAASGGPRQQEMSTTPHGEGMLLSTCVIACVTVVIVTSWGHVSVTS